LKKTTIAALILTAISSVAGAQADNSEAAFKAALGYTVQIRTAVTTPLEGDTKGTSRGAGFVVDLERGWIMTNAHVVSRSPSRVEVALRNGEYVEAEKIYVDPHLDLAIIKLPQSLHAGVTQAPIECRDTPAVGHTVGAFGHPWNLSYTGTRGIISGVTSRTSIELMQTDAPINGGNSGGPLISLATQRIVGINTAGIQGSQNTNFAVAMPYACRVLDLLRAGADPSPPLLPVVYFNEREDAPQLKVARNYGGTDAIGLQPGDVIEGVTGVTGAIRNETQLYHALRGRLDSFELNVLRNGVRITVRGTAHAQQTALDTQGVVTAGILFAPTPLRDAAEVKVGAMMVHFVDRGSDGDAKELRRGDFLEAVNGRSVSNVNELREALSQAGATATLTLKRYSGGQRVFTYLERQIRLDRVETVAGRATQGVAAGTNASRIN